MPLFPDLLQYGDLGLFLLRLVLGGIFIIHALPKLMKSSAVAKGMKWAPASVFTLGLAEFLGGLGVILGVYPQLGALLLAIVMLGALYYKIFRWGKKFTYFGKDEGWEIDLLLLVAALAVLFTGGGPIGIL